MRFSSALNLMFALSVPATMPVHGQAVSSMGEEFIAVDYCPSEKDVLLPFSNVVEYEYQSPLVMQHWSSCADVCRDYLDQCQFAYFDDGKCYIYTKSTENPDELPLNFENMNCKTTLHGSGGKYLVREYQYVTEFGKDVPVGGLGHALRKKIKIGTENGIFDRNINMGIPFVNRMHTRHCDSNYWKTTNKCSNYSIRKAIYKNSKCGAAYVSARVEWSTSLDDIDDASDMSVGDFWRTNFKDYVMTIINESATAKAEAYRELHGRSGRRCGRNRLLMESSEFDKDAKEDFQEERQLRRGRSRRSFRVSSYNYVSERMPEKMNFKLVRYKKEEVNEGEIIDVIANFRYELEGINNFVWDSSSYEAGGTFCSDSSSAVGATMGMMAMLTGHPVLGAVGLLNAVGCMAVE